jgi:hypothetical protein
MSVKRMIIYLVVVLFLVANTALLGASDGKNTNIQTIILEDFELVDGQPKRMWVLIPDRFGREGNKEGGESLQKLSFVNAWPEAYFGSRIPGKDRGEFSYGPKGANDDERSKYIDVSGYCLAMWITFNRPGYNRVELYPLAKDGGGTWVKEPIQFVGKIQKVDMWIWGANFNYNMDMVIVDFRGSEHRLSVGNIKHIGWKNFIVNIPHTIPQSIDYVPSLKTLSLQKFIIWTDPTENVKGAYIYLDQIKYVTDVFTEIYDGYQLGDPDHTKKVWEKNKIEMPKDTDVKSHAEANAK